jgi:TRAP-type mannitol/chloroaromatic compound transport system permease small subunit
MSTPERIADRLDRWVSRIGLIAGWAVFGLIIVTVFDVVTRRLLVLGSTKLQEAEWHFHVILFACCLGFAVLRDAHVRIEILRHRFSPRARDWVEFLGSLCLMLPFCAIVIYYGTVFTVASFLDGEGSASATGLGHRWLIKLFLPFGFSLLALSGIAVTLRNAARLFVPPNGGRKDL